MSTKILLVDDNADLLQITQIILKAQGYESILATTIEEAERKIKIHKPALILLDASICEQDDGRVFCNELRANAITAGIRVILMSGSEYRNDELNGAHEFLQKPFDFMDLTSKVDKQMKAAQFCASTFG